MGSSESAWEILDTRRYRIVIIQYIWRAQKRSNLPYTIFSRRARERISCPYVLITSDSTNADSPTMCPTKTWFYRRPFILTGNWWEYRQKKLFRLPWAHHVFFSTHCLHKDASEQCEHPHPPMYFSLAPFKLAHVEIIMAYAYGI